MSNYTQFKLRLPTDVHAALSLAARENKRSMSSEVERILRDALQGDLLGSAEPQVSVLRQIAADIRAMREMQERQQRPRIEVTPRTMPDMQARPSAQALRHTNGEGE